MINSDFVKKTQKSYTLTPMSLTKPLPAAISPNPGPLVSALFNISLYFILLSSIRSTSKVYMQPLKSISAAYIQPLGTEPSIAVYGLLGIRPTFVAYMEPLGISSTNAAYMQLSDIRYRPATYFTVILSISGTRLRFGAYILPLGTRLTFAIYT